jgi:hypothetical protein
MSAVTIDGAVMSEARGCVTTMVKNGGNGSNNTDLITLHRTQHQENLCMKSFSGSQHVMSVVVKLVNCITSTGLNHRQFQHLLSELGSRYMTLLLTKKSAKSLENASGCVCFERRNTALHATQREDSSRFPGYTVDVDFGFLF